MQKTERNRYIDTLKFLLIFAIYIGHYGESAGKLYPFVFTYHIQLFFVVSGFWFLDRERRPLLDHIAQGLKRYILPWLIWVMIYVITKSIQREYAPGEVYRIFLRYFQSIKGSGVSGMWFVPCFFFVSVAYQVLDRTMGCLRGGYKSFPTEEFCF